MRKKVCIMMITLFIASILWQGSVFSLGVGPSRLSFYNALKGETYEKTTKIFNTDDIGGTFMIDNSSEISEWLEFYPEYDLETHVTNFTIEANSDVLLLVRVNVPPDTPNGNYTFRFYVQRAPEDGEMISGQNVVMKIPLTAFVEVVGDQILAGDVMSITAKDTEVSYPLRVSVQFRNTGNVVANPLVRTIIRKGDSDVDQFEFTGPDIKVGTVDIFKGEWDTSGNIPGAYEADVSVLLDNNIILEKTLNFTLLERGTLSAKGEVLEIDYDDSIEADKTSKVNVNFRNTGDIDIRAKITGEVYLNDEFIGVIEGDEVLIKVNEEANLTAYFSEKLSGTYIIKPLVIYEGKKTELDDITITVSGGVTGMIIGSEADVITGLVVAIIVIVIIIVLIIRRKRKSPAHKYKYSWRVFNWVVS